MTDQDEGTRNCSSRRTFFARSEGCRQSLETTHNPKVVDSNPTIDLGPNTSREGDSKSRLSFP